MCIRDSPAVDWPPTPPGRGWGAILTRQCLRLVVGAYVTLFGQPHDAVFLGEVEGGKVLQGRVYAQPLILEVLSLIHI